MKTAILALTSGGRALAATIAEELDDSHVVSVDTGIAAAFRDNWKAFDGFIAIMATGITIRAIAPLLGDKTTDPAVVCLDEKGRHCISLLSGHLGGGNALAARVAAVTGGEAVITTASDTLELVPLDLWAAAQNLRCADQKILTAASSTLVNQGRLHVFSEVGIEALPPGLVATDTMEHADLVITHRQVVSKHNVPKYSTLQPANLVVGIGCNRNTPISEFEEALHELFTELGLSPLAIRNLASIEAKNDEVGLLRFAALNDWYIDFFTPEMINRIEDITVSSAALKAVGAKGVAEPTALLSANTTTLLSRKRKWQNITMAVARAPFTLSARVLEHLNT